MAIDIELLKGIYYFDGCSSDELDPIKNYFTWKNVQKGQLFLIEGDWSDYTYFIISGVVKIYKISPDNKDQILHIARHGESLNDVSTFIDSPNVVNMLAMTPLVLYMIRRNDLKTILWKHPRIAMNALKALANKVQHDSSLVEDLSFIQVTGRLAKMLLKRAEEGTDVGLKITQQDMAAMIGTSREVANRSLKALVQKGAIRLEHRGIVIINTKALEGIVETFS